MKKLYKILVATLLLSLLIVGAALASQPIETKSITVVGAASREVGPDTAFINMAVETRADNANAAKNANSKIMNKVLENLKKNGIAEKDIKTTGYNLSQDYKQDEKNKRIPAGYVLVHSLNVKVKDVESTGNVIDIMQNSGANKFYGVDFTVSDTEKIQRELLAAATKNGREKAEIVASADGRHVGPMISAKVGAVGGATEDSLRNRALMKTFAAAEFSPETQITAGTMTISVSVEVAFELR